MLFEVFAANPEDPLDTGVDKLRKSLERVLETGIKDLMPLQRYPIKKTLSDGTDFFEERVELHSELTHIAI